MKTGRIRRDWNFSILHWNAHIQNVHHILLRREEYHLYNQCVISDTYKPKLVLSKPFRRTSIDIHPTIKHQKNIWAFPRVLKWYKIQCQIMQYLQYNSSSFTYDFYTKFRTHDILTDVAERYRQEGGNVQSIVVFTF